MDFFPHEFEAEICHHWLGTYCYNVVFLPQNLHAHLPLEKHPRLRIDAEVSSIPLQGAWQPSRGRWYLMLSPKLLRQGSLSVGSQVEVRFRVADQDEVSLPAELATCLGQDAELRMAWSELTVGKQRALSHRLDSAKRIATRQARLEEIVRALKGGEPGPLARVLGILQPK